MKKLTFVLTVALVTLVLASCNQKGDNASFDAKDIELTTEMDTVSYALGSNVGSQMKQMGVTDFNIEVFAAAFAQSLGEEALLMDPMQGGQILDRYFQAKQQEMMAAQQAGAGDNLKAGQEFLAKNKSAEGVQVTASGLQYIVLNEGTGAKATTADRVRVHYHGTMIDGTVFDSSVDKGTPAEFGVTEVIAGWTEALQLMNKGAKLKLFVPSELAYGPQARSAVIGPNSTLIFEVELLEIL